MMESQISESVLMITVFVLLQCSSQDLCGAADSLDSVSTDKKTHQQIKAARAAKRTKYLEAGVRVRRSVLSGDVT